MAEQPQRPRFTDGQPLAAADLELAVDHGRDRDARHERALHTPGIALGLRLVTEDVPMQADAGPVVTKRITVSAGLAVDGDGRQVVFANDESLLPEQFADNVGVAREIDPSVPGGQTTFPYPVLLTADDRDGSAPAFTAQACGSATGPSRTVEDYQLRIGRRGEHLTLAAQQALGPGGTLDVSTRPFRLLLGFVRFHVVLRRYVQVLDEVDNVRPRRAGVRAGEVVTADDRLLFRVGEPAAAGQPALVLDAAGGGRLRFGPLSAQGGVADVFSVTAQGDMTVRGRTDPGLVVGVVRMYSAVVTDGMPVPLPAGVSEADVSSRRAAIHIWVTPRYPVATGQAAVPAAFAVGRCAVDDRRVVRCQLFKLTAVTPGDEAATVQMTPLPAAACDVVVAAVVLPPDQPGGGTP